MNTQFNMYNKQLFVWIYIVLSSVNFRGSYCQFVHTPKNTWAYVGQSVTLGCTIENAGREGHLQVWREYITNSGGRVVSRDGTALDEKYQIVDQFNLKINAVELGDGGTYSCEDVLVNRGVYKADLVILESDPTLTSSISSGVVMENTQVRYTCKMSYQGKLIPVIEWQNSNGESITHSDSSTSSYVETSILITAGPSNNGYIYSCQTYFEDITGAQDLQATNKISYSHRLSAATLGVHYMPRDTEIVDLSNNPINGGSNIFAGTQLRCKTDSNPPPRDYVWTNVGEVQVVSTDSIYRIGEDLIGELSLACTVTNYMGETVQVEGKDTVVVSFNVIGSDSSGTNGGGTNEGDDAEKPLSNGEIIGIALGVAVFLAVVIVVTIIFVHRRRTKKTTKITRYKKNENGENEVVETIETVETAGRPDTAPHDTDSVSGTLPSLHGYSDTDEELTDEKPNVVYTNNNATFYADNASEGPPPYDTRNNIGSVV